jgi:hypothetical protein
VIKGFKGEVIAYTGEELLLSHVRTENWWSGAGKCRFCLHSHSARSSQT